MTYTEAHALIQGGAIPADAPPGLEKALGAMHRLAQALRKKRMERGSLDFDLPEPEILLDLEGRVESFRSAERNEAHMLIEDLMIAANEAVAEFLAGRKSTALFRVHEKPDPRKIGEVEKTLKNLGIGRAPGSSMATRVAHLAAGLRALGPGKSLEHLVLRSLMPAAYATANLGHFGLASTAYTHFTSPIRRYPDLIVHRLLKSALSQGASGPPAKTAIPGALLADMAARCSELERRAERAERDAVTAYGAWFMKAREGEILEAFIQDFRQREILVGFPAFQLNGLFSFHLNP